MKKTSFLVISSIFIIVSSLVVAKTKVDAASLKRTPWNSDDIVPVQCPGIRTDGTTESGFTGSIQCFDPKTNASISDLGFPYETDTQVTCAIFLSRHMFSFLRGVAHGKASWTCRVPVSKESKEHVPLTLHVWSPHFGDWDAFETLNSPSLQVLTHLNFVFHSLEGFIVGASAYSIFDDWKTVHEFQMLPLSGQARWFYGNTFDPASIASQLPWYQSLFSGLVPGSSPGLSTNQLYFHQIPTASTLRSAVKFEVFVGWILIVAVLSAAFWYLVLIWLPKAVVVVREMNEDPYKMKKRQ